MSMDIASRAELLMSSEITQVAGGSLTIGPYTHDVLIQRFGVLVSLATTVGNTTITLTCGSTTNTLTVPTGTPAGTVMMKTAIANPGASETGVSKAGGLLILPAGSTASVAGDLVATSAGKYYISVEKVTLPIDNNAVV